MEAFLQSLLTGGGVAGLILGFHLWKLAPELRAIWRAIDRRNRIDILKLAASPMLSAEAKREVACILEEMDGEEKSAKNREVIPP
jgi:hypothetical protein